MGADHEIGSLRPGKRADVIAVSSRGWPGEEVEFLVMDAQPADIHSVFVGGVPTRTDAIGTRGRPNWPAARAGNALVHGADPNRRRASACGIGICDGAGPRETVLGVPQ